MTLAIYPGSFDPVTLGHLDIVERAATVFDQVVVAVMTNPAKNPLFSVEERCTLLRDAVRHLPGVQVDSFPGLLVDYFKQVGAGVIIKGLRAVSDYESEFQMASMNRQLLPGCETLFMATSSRFSYLSSSIVKEIARYGGTVSALVPANVEEALQKKFQRRAE